jgi:hypothetical protein
MKKVTTNKGKYQQIAVILGLSKGEGEYPSLKTLSSSEIKDPRTYANFYLDIDQSLEGVPKLKDFGPVTVIYDGVSPLNTLSDGDNTIVYGLNTSPTAVEGKIRPILKFSIKGEVDPETFLRGVWGSYYMLLPKKQNEPFYAEDWNGYSSILTSEELQSWIELVKEGGRYCGGIFPIKKLMGGMSASNFKYNMAEK